MTGVIYNLPERNFDFWPERRVGLLVAERVGKPGPQLLGTAVQCPPCPVPTALGHCLFIHNVISSYGNWELGVIAVALHLRKPKELYVLYVLILKSRRKKKPPHHSTIKTNFVLTSFGGGGGGWVGVGGVFPFRLFFFFFFPLSIFALSRSSHKILITKNNS